jgi:mRNA interferase HigB
MHVISRKPLMEFWIRYPDSKEPLLRWYRIMQTATFENWGNLRAVFPSADKVDHWIVFNISGNKYRLISAIHFNQRKVYIRHVLTHQEYDRGGWKR